MKKNKILYIDMDNVLVDFPSGIDRINAKDRQTYMNDYDNTPGIFALMDPMEGAIEAYEKLNDVYDTYILSTAPWDNPSAWCDKLNWVKKHLGAVARKRLILSHHKNLNNGDYLVDDRTKRGVDLFVGEHIHFGTDHFPDWNSVCDYLLPDEKKF